MDDATIRQIECELEKAERGMAMPYDAERVGRSRKMLVEARKRKLSEGLARLRTRGKARPNLLTSPCPMADAAITGASARAHDRLASTARVGLAPYRAGNEAPRD
jgi:hypothetical protein